MRVSTCMGNVYEYLLERYLFISIAHDLHSHLTCAGDYV